MRRSQARPRWSESSSLPGGRGIVPSDNGPPPALPGYTTEKEYTPTLKPPAWTNALPEVGAPGFFRYKLVK